MCLVVEWRGRRRIFTRTYKRRMPFYALGPENHRLPSHGSRLRDVENGETPSMSAALTNEQSRYRSRLPRMLLGLLWGALALLLAFWFLSSTELAIMPRSGATIGDLLAQAVAATAGDVSEFRGL